MADSGSCPQDAAAPATELNSDGDPIESSEVMAVDDGEYFDACQQQEEEEDDLYELDHAYHNYLPTKHDGNNDNKKEIDDSMEASLITTSASSATACSAAPAGGGRNNSNNKLVRFHRIEIREYGVTLGDHPGTRIGPPVTIEWDHQAELVVDLDQYERIFSGVGSSAKFRRRKGEELRMPPDVRENMLIASHGGEKGMKKAAELLLLQQQLQLPPHQQHHHHCHQFRKPGVKGCCRRAGSVARRIGRECLLGLISWNERLEEAWQSAVRKFTRWRKRRKGIKPEPAELWIETCIPKEIIFF
ncbi:hypothetical protein ACA910_019422 [Epithemia clementina (nom. ined.)]